MCPHCHGPYDRPLKPKTDKAPEAQKDWIMKKGTINYNIGHAKYVVNYSDGTKKHKDGSEQFDIAIFRNKKKMEAFIKANHIAID
jgi:hypothetical protein